MSILKDHIDESFIQILKIPNCRIQLLFRVFFFISELPQESQSLPMLVLRGIERYQVGEFLRILREEEKNTESEL